MESVFALGYQESLKSWTSVSKRTLFIRACDEALIRLKRKHPNLATLPPAQLKSAETELWDTVAKVLVEMAPDDPAVLEFKAVRESLPRWAS